MQRMTNRIGTLDLRTLPIDRLNRLMSNTTLIYSIWLIIGVYSIARITVGVTNPDGGYFLPISRDIVSLQLAPIRDIYSPYTPLGFYIYSIVFLLIKNPSIEYFYLFNLLLISLTTFIFIRSIRLLSIKAVHLHGLVFFCVLNSLIYDIKLELVVLLLAALCLYSFSRFLKTGYNRWLPWCGFLIGTTVLCKQYALMLLPSFIILFWLLNGNKLAINEIALVIIGFIVTIVGYFLFEVFGMGVPLNHVFNQFIGRSFYDCATEYGNKDFSSFLGGFRYWALKMPLFFFVFAFSFIKLIRKKERGFFVMLFLTLLYLLPFYFKVFPHYFYFGFIPLFVASIYLLNEATPVQRLASHSFLLFIVLISLYSVFNFMTYYRQLASDKLLVNEYYEEIAKYVPEGSVAIVEGPKAIYFENELSAPDLGGISYGLATRINISCHLESIKRLSEKPDNIFYIGPHPMFAIDSYQLVSADSVTRAKQSKTNIYRFHKI